MTIIAAYTRSYREAQTYLGLITLVPILPMMFASMMGLAAHGGADGDAVNESALPDYEPAAR